MFSFRAWASIANNSLISSTARIEAASCLLSLTAFTKYRRQWLQQAACTIFGPPTPIVGGICIRLQKSFEVSEEIQRAFPFAAHAKIENRHAARSSVLPEIRLMVGTAAVVRLHIHRSFIGLDIGAGQQLAAHRSNHRHQHFSDGHHPAAHRGPADIDAGVAQQGYALSIIMGRGRSTCSPPY